MAFSQSICSTHSVRAVKMVLALFLLSILLPACMKPTPTPAPSLQKVWTIENAGQICFREYTSTRELRGVFRPTGCFSSSCTVPQEQQVDVQLDNSQAALEFVTKFVLLDTRVRTPVKICTTDCDGGGEVQFKLADVMTGTYTVLLGDQKMGSLEIPPSFEKKEGICFGELY